MENITEESIPTGSFVIDKKENRILVSHLGSCVGLVLIDEKNEIGGMYHILLPAPTQDNLAHVSFNFASAGMPNFIDEFVKYGADLNSTKAIIAGGALLGAIPQVALKISRMLNSDNYGMKEIAKEIRNDQIISAKVIQLCNSAFMGLKSKISSVDQAIVLLGEKALVKIVLQSSMELFYQDIEKGYSLTKRGLYYHAIATATAAEQIAKLTKKAEPDIAYTAGLLHDIGKIVLDQFIAQVFPTFFDRIFNEKEDLLAVEENLLGIDHTAAGKRLAELWKLPENLQQTILNHHNPENAIESSELVHIVYFADLIISRFHTGIEIDRLNTNNFSNRLNVLGLKSDGFLNLVNSISWKEVMN